MQGTLSGWQELFDSPVVGSVVKTDADNSDRAVADTVGLMAGHIQSAARSPQVRRAIQGAGITKDDSDKQKIEKCFRWIKANVKFKRDEDQLDRIFEDRNWPTSKDLLITPQVLLSMNQPQGDCDDFSMLCASMLGALDVQCNLVTIAADKEYPEQFTHIYCCAVTKQGEQVPIDSSHGQRVGWELPTNRKQIWPVMNRQRGDNMRVGLGDDGSVYDLTGIYSDTGWNVPSGVTSSVGSGNTWLEGLISNVANVGGKLALQVTQKPGVQSSVYNPLTGQTQTTSMVAAPGQAVSTINIPGLTTSGSLSPMVIIGGLAVLGLVAYMAKR